MAAVTQKTSNFLGGVSQQAEELMLPGQLLDASNAYIDPTLGLLKRPGLEHVNDLKTSGGVAITPSNTLRSARWFPIFLGPGVNFFGCVGTNTIRVFGTDGIERTVNTPNGTSYLSTITDLNDVTTLTVNEYTFITNKKTTVTAQAAPVFNANRSATVVISEIHYGAQYSLTFILSGVTTTITYTTFNAEAAITTPAQSERSVTANKILLGLQALLPAGYTGVIIGNTLEITRNTGVLDFTCTAAGTLSGTGITAIQDSVSDISKLPSKSTNNRLVKIENSDGAEDDYWVKFVAQNGVNGDGYWTEWVAPNASPGITASTAPHILTYDPGNGQFTFAQAPYVARLVGDTESNPNPSFIGKQIKATFFSNNRLGFLTNETIIMSQVNDFFNFFAGSAITSTDSDPVDRSVSSLSTVRLSSVHPTPQGLLLFGDNQQFIAESTNGVFTPSNTTIKTLSNYQTEANVAPADLGTTVGFISRAGAYTRMFEMLSRGQNEQPEIVELTKIIPEWIPSSVNILSSSPQAGVVVCGTCGIGGASGTIGSKDVYVFRYWLESQVRSQAWTRWEFPEPVVMMHLDQETLWVLLDGDRTGAGAPKSYPLCRINLNQQSAAVSAVNYTFVPTGLSATGRTIRAEPKLDYFKICTDLVWDEVNNKTLVYLPSGYIPATGVSVTTLGNTVISTNPNGTEPDAGFLRIDVPVFLQSGGAFNGRYYVEVAEVNLTTYTATFIYGLTYTCGLELPRTYFRRTGGNDQSQASDYTAELTIQRMRFVFGITGPVEFFLRTRGRENWTKVQAIPNADYYEANDLPLTDSAIFTLPIHQKNDNFSVRLDSPTTLPFTLLSSSWEGNYAPRFYRRT